MPLEHVEGIHDAAKDMTREKLVECVKRLALSHERLRAELAGAAHCQAKHLALVDVRRSGNDTQWTSL